MMNKNIYILNLETTTKNCSVSLSCNKQTVALKELNNGQYTHAEYINQFIQDVLQKGQISFAEIDAIAVSQGPGSYTGLRIGVSTAKGLCYALSKPLIAVDTMKVLANQIQVDNGVVVSVLDARRMEVYQAVFNVESNLLEQTKPVVLEATTYDKYLLNNKVHIVGNCIEKMKPIFNSDNIIFHPETYPSAQQMSEIAYQQYKYQDFVDVAYFEPFYLKSFIPGKATK